LAQNQIALKGTMLVLNKNSEMTNRFKMIKTLCSELPGLRYSVAALSTRATESIKNKWLING
jgi:hypothetical protein